MKDMIYERLILLSKAQEQITSVIDKLEHLDNAQLIMEKNAFESINVSDRVLNMSQEGKHLVALMKDYYLNSCDSLSNEEKCKIAPLLDEIQSLFHDIKDLSVVNNDLSHKIEEEAAGQKVTNEEIKKSITNVGDSVAAAAACAEFVLAEI